MEPASDISANKAAAKEKIRKLVEEFSKRSREELDSKPEEQIKWHFIEPLLGALGWEKQDIDKESRVLHGRADYVLKSGNQDLLVVEAKKTSVSLSEEEGRQAVSYAYHRKIKFAVLTNFKQIRVYHALSNIKNINKNLIRDGKGYLYIDFQDFDTEFDRLWLLSKESLLNGELLKCLPKKEERVSKPIDESILEDLLQYREWLSKDLKSHRVHLSNEQIDEIVQILIDRLIFIRSVEDRGLEDKDILLKVVTDYRQGRNSRRVWDTLLSMFREFDGKYNSKLFSEGLLEKEGFFSEEGSLLKVIAGLYYGTTGNRDRYMFDVIPGDLLGNIYEQYLGVILKGSEKRVKLEGGTGKRKSMGIYYTPAYIVDYIVKNTVGEYIKGKTIDEILEVKILDPACGSGSFLIRAFQEVCNAVEDRLKRGETSNKWKVFNSYKDRLILGQKIQILTKCIFGVDLDEKAVELAQLNLLLKLLEDEEALAKKHLLPSMKDNIKCGNSLIDDPEIAGDKAFNWHAQFSEINRNGGFNVIIGNPPYVRNDTLPKEEKQYYMTSYKSASGKFDLYLVFIEKAISLLNDDGIKGFIIPSKFMAADYGFKLRRLILEKCSIKQIIDVSQLPVFKNVATYPCIIILQKNSKEDTNNKIKIVKGITSKEDFEQLHYKSVLVLQKDFKNTNNYLFVLSTDKKSNELMTRLSENQKLAHFCEIKAGIHNGNIRNKLIKNRNENSYCKRLLVGSDVHRYSKIWSGLYIDYNPNIADKNKGEYCSLREERIFKAREKILIRDVGKRLPATYDNEQLYCMDSLYIVLLRNEFQKTINLKYILGTLNSNLIDFYFRKMYGTVHVGSNYQRYKRQFLVDLPIKIVSNNDQNCLVAMVDKMLSFQKKHAEESLTGNEKERLEQQIRNIDYEIDQEVYKFYGITKEEQKIIEEGLKK